MKKDIILIIILMILILVGVLFFHHTEDERKPDEGIYWINQNSYYAVTKEEDITLGVDCFLVTVDSSNPLQRLKEFSFLDETGNEFDILSKDYEIVYAGNVGKAEDGTVIDRYIIYLSTHSADSVVLTHVQYEEEGTTVNKEIGRIEIECIDNNEEISALQNRIDWMTITQPTFDHGEYIIENKLTEDIEVMDISYGDSLIRINNFKKFIVQGLKEKEVSMDIALEEELGKSIVYYMKPIITYEVNGEVKRVPFNNVSKEAYYGEYEIVKENLYQMSKGNE